MAVAATTTASLDDQLDEYTKQLALELLGTDGPEPEDLPPEAINASSSSEGEVVEEGEDGQLQKKKKKKKPKTAASESGKGKKGTVGRGAKGKGKGKGKPETPEEKAAAEAARIKAAQELLDMPLKPPVSLENSSGSFQTDVEMVMRWNEEVEGKIRNALLCMTSERAPQFMARCAEVLRQTGLYLNRLLRHYQETHRTLVSMTYTRQRLTLYGDRKGVTALSPLSK
jgi:hypothetical protein